jgi:uncharacterized protein
MSIKPITFKNASKQVLHGFVHAPKNYTKAVIFLHGFPSSCQGHTAPRLAYSLFQKKYLVLRFSFSHTPPSEGKFEDKLMSNEVKDIRYAINFLHDNYHFKELILIGHSTGAIDAALYAHNDKRISKLILMGAVSHLNEAVRYDFTDQQVHDFWKLGYVKYSRPGKWVDQKKINKTFYDEFFKLDIPKAIKKWRKPILILHGENDEAIPVAKDPKELYDFANKPKKLVIIRGANHQFGNPLHWKKMIKQIHLFIK